MGDVSKWKLIGKKLYNKRYETPLPGDWELPVADTLGIIQNEENGYQSYPYIGSDNTLKWRYEANVSDDGQWKRSSNDEFGYFTLKSKGKYDEFGNFTLKSEGKYISKRLMPYALKIEKDNSELVQKQQG